LVKTVEQPQLIVGWIVSTHGVQGGVLVRSTTDFPRQRFTKGTQLKLRDPRKIIAEQKLTITSTAQHKKKYLLRFKECNSLSRASLFVGCSLHGLEPARISRLKGEYHINELVGCAVKDLDGQLLGVISDVWAKPANDVLVVKGVTGQELLLPFIKAVVKKVDLLNKELIVELFEGLV
jgi:16S rRNA processing protein RimM